MPVHIVKQHKPPPKCSNPRIDKLAMVLDVPPKVQTQLVLGMKIMPGVYSTKLYEFNTKVKVPAGILLKGKYSNYTWLRVSCSPRPSVSPRKFLRIEFNPTKTSTTAVAQLLREHYLLEWKWARKHAKVTRLDVAVDIAGLHITDVTFYAAKLRTEQVHNSNGVTHYIGGTSSDRYFAIYDKRAEIIAKNKILPDHVQKPVPTQPVTRVEVRLRPNCLLSFLPKVRNGFEPLWLSNLTYTGSKGWQYSLAFELARFIGMTAVLSKLPQSERDRVMWLLQKFPCHFWDSDLLWKGFKDAAKEVLYPAL